MLDIDVGLCPLQSEAVCSMPVIRVRFEPEYVLITLAGEVDFAAVASLRERLFALATRGQPMVADLDQVSFIDAAGLGHIVRLRQTLAATGRALTLHRPSTHIVRTFAAGGLRELLEPDQPR